MSRGVTVKVEGLKDLEKALSELKVSTARNIARRGLKQALEPMAEAARRRVPSMSGDLAESINVTTKNPKRNRKQSQIEAHMGPGRHPQGPQTEFGNRNHGPQPFMRPAWEEEKHGALESLAGILGEEIDKAAKRAARKAARTGA
ncbi:HK97-gp10 family putative phage morphogenesis protein [Brevundimonas bullata]|uniref:HK97-gp10 family putative phage morphogenesis protein n=1 Tax=Brevundimonas bullata TaxID=13160 RepID=UPI000E0B9B5B|nr:HK97-gp10 family putative phage morphogenesis protein [Brevundimonas bullata]WQE36729.1 HK97-gp10 family putative phage morphogenesis protein [Brevundimonas bullata]